MRRSAAAGFVAGRSEKRREGSDVVAVVVVVEFRAIGCDVRQWTHCETAEARMLRRTVNTRMPQATSGV